MQEAIIVDRRQTGFVNPLRVHKALTAGMEKRGWFGWLSAHRRSSTLTT